MATGMPQQRSDCRVAPFVREAGAGPGSSACTRTRAPRDNREAIHPERLAALDIGRKIMAGSTL
jgi:hypothetical protein